MKRTLSLLLALVMVISMVPAVFAETTDDSEVDFDELLPCEHIEKTYTDNKDGTHTVTCPDCDEFEPINEEHTYTDGTCVCGAVEVIECPHTTTEVKIENEVASTWEKVGSYDEVTYCTECGEKISSVTKAALLNPFYNNSMSLKNNLTLVINIKKDTLDAEKLAAGEYYALVTRTDAEGVRHETEIPMSEWKEHTKNRMQIYFNKLAAKEMADDLEVVLYNSDKEQVSVALETSVAKHSLSEIEQYLDLGGYDKFVTLYVDMLNYGAAAQNNLGYNTGNLANSELTSQMQTYATQETTYLEEIDKSGFVAYQNTNMDLKNNIVMNLVFWNDSFGVDLSEVVAKVKYSHHSDAADVVNEKEIEFGEWTSKGTRKRCKLAIDWLVIADGNQVITVDFYDLDGNKLGTVSEALSAALGTFAEVQPDEELWPTLNKFMNSAYAALH